ncbi:putative ABC-type transport system involved in lysophospholipase L1 biosynthesis, permease component [Thioflavicoccus mobilis 8321]|uniref:Putative ABC-type transport system involved in lysophospholipase L1 biosynthesis, permease component n=1 Tax=Thioflavicoccus mobilis 8321 TaxID=765912 RepID=L0GY90_9GAMM|nr:FtsX-like permease family protein [Thioflavicoccus mobilis]AGA90345.1 putative ABC-type transport system involved in lysophospholipase L1 biosynthesis, permease component [Thioflavicoccus mobilis 8321]
MTAWRITLRLLRRDWRSGELSLLAAAVVLTVAAITAVGFFTDRVEGAMARQGSELIAADLVIESSAPPAAEFDEKAAALGLAKARTLEFSSIVTTTDAPRLVQVKAVDPDYPLHGQLRTRATATAPIEAADEGPAPGTAWVEPRLLYLLDAAPGDRLRLGEAEFTINRLIAYEPDRADNLFEVAPRVMISTEDIPATGLVTPMSRIDYRLLLAGDQDALAEFRTWAESRLPMNADFIDAREARPAFEDSIARASNFLHLAALATLLVAGAALALASRRMVERQTDAVAVMRCLGAPRHLLTRIFILRLAGFGLIAGIAGSLLGFLAQFGLAALLGSLFNTDLPMPSLRPIAVGIGTGLVALLGFALPPLLQLARVPPLHVLRRDLGAPRLSAALALMTAAAAFALLVFWQAGDPQLAWKLLVGVAATLAALALLVAVMVRLGRVLSHRARGVWRLGLAALTRRPRAALLQITGFGLAILALLLLAVVRVDLMNAWQQSLPEGAPNRFLVNIQPDDVPALRAFLAEHQIDDSGLFPIIRGRLTAIDGRPVDPDAYEDGRARRLAAHEFNLTYADRPQSDNRIVAGRWWQGEDAPPQLSVESGLAETLGIKLGDELSFWVSGREVSAPVTSLREVRWDSFNANFFVIVSPSLLGDEATTYLTSIYLAPAQERLIPELVRRFPSVTLFDVVAILDQVRRVIERAAWAVEYVFLFTLAAGLLVMYAGIQASVAERRAEHGVLRTLGAGRRKLLAGLAVEFTLAGVLAGLVAALAAEVTGFVMARQVFDLAFTVNPWLWAGGVLGSGLAIGLAGTLAAYPFLVHPPLPALREEG